LPYGTAAAFGEPAALGFVLVGGMFGGIAAAFVWVAQGSYFASNARYYAVLANVSQEEATNVLSGIFACWYLALEMLVKVAASTILFIDERNEGYLKNAEVTVFLLFGVASTLCTLSMSSLQDIEESDCNVPVETGTTTEEGLEAGKEESSPADTDKEKGSIPFMVQVKLKYKATTQLLTGDNKMILMFLFNASFGLFSSLNNFYLGGEVVSTTIGSEYVGFLSAITSLVAALFSFVLPYLMSNYGRTATMAIGSSSWMIYVVLLLFLSTASAGTWQVLIPLYILAGLGRGTWEAVVKAIWADFFADEDVGAAFAGLHVQSGATGALGYFLFPNIEARYQLLLCLVVIPLGYRDYWVAMKIHKEGKREKRN
jgi:hypothetical protein